MTTRIAILGGPRCGKTTLMHQLCVDMKIMGINAGCKPEYSTQYLKEKEMIESISEQYGIYLGQAMIDEELSEFKYAITDYATFLPYIYGRFMLGDKERTKKEIEILKDLYNLALRDIPKYDYVFYVPREFGYTKDGVRWQDEEMAASIDGAIRTFLDSENVKYIELKGNTKDRANRIMDILNLNNKEQKQG